jgi:hypothetical protein
VSFLDCAECSTIHCKHQCAESVDPAVAAERERVLAIVIEEAAHYSKGRENVVPAEIAVVFANAVCAKARTSIER